MSTYERVADLPLTIDDYALEGSARSVSQRLRAPDHGDPPARRRRGGRRRGRHLRRRRPASPSRSTARCCRSPASGRSTRSPSTSATLDLFPAGAPTQPVFRNYRRWGVRERGARPRAAPGGHVAGRRRSGASCSPVTLRRLHADGRAADDRAGHAPPRALPRPALQARRHAGLGRRADRRAWSRPARSTRSTSRAPTRARRSTSTTDPAFYRRIAEAFPDAWLEDPDLEPPDAREALRPFEDRITWDAPIHSVDDILAAPVLPRTVNLKPSRFGQRAARCSRATTSAPSAAWARTAAASTSSASGRGQIQYLAALFHADAPNDIAPSGYDALDPEPGLPESPLDPDPEPTGFRRRS